MPRIELLEDTARLRLLADPRRMRILRLLMGAPASLTGLARTLRRSPAWVRHHLLALQAVGLVELVEVRVTGRVTEKFYRARSEAFLLHRLILPQGRRGTVLFSGSDEPALTWLGARLEKHLSLHCLSVGSLDGLIHLRQGLCQISGAHLLDETGEYNLPFLRRLFPDRTVKVVTLAGRTQGWMLAPGNPKNFHDVRDLARPGVSLANRNPGSGTRLWLDRELRRAGLLPGQVQGYAGAFATHAGAAAQVRTGQADLALGLQDAALKAGLDFIPLFEERYDLVFEPEAERSLTPILEQISTGEFRAFLTSRSGYNTAHTGESIHFQENP